MYVRTCTFVHVHKRNYRSLTQDTYVHTYHAQQLSLTKTKYLPLKVHMHTNTHQKIHIFCWYWHTHGCLVGERSSQDTLSCRPTADRWSPEIASPGPHNLRERGSLHWVGNHRTRTAAVGPCTVHGCHLGDLNRNTTCMLTHSSSIVLYKHTRLFEFSGIKCLFSHTTPKSFDG